MIVEYDAEAADEAFDELPDIGDTIMANGQEATVVTVDVVNDSLLSLDVVKKRDVRYFDDYHHPSVDWEELPERFLNSGPDEQFLDKGTLK